MIHILSYSRVSERSRTATFWFTARRAETATPQTPYILSRSAAPTRTRTRNASLEARHDLRFTIEAHIASSQRKAWDSNPHPRRARTALANRPGQPYPATFRIFSGPTGNRTRISSHARAGVVPLDHEPVRISGPAGESNPDFLVAKPGVFPLDQQPIYLSEVRPGIEPGLPPYRGGVLPKHLQTNFASVIPDGIEPSLSWMSPRRLRRWTTGSVVSDRGGSRTHKITRLSTSSLCQFAYPVSQWRVRESHPAGRAYETRLSTGPPAINV